MSDRCQTLLLDIRDLQLIAQKEGGNGFHEINKQTLSEVDHDTNADTHSLKLLL